MSQSKESVTEEEVNKFVNAWYLALDQHVSREEIAKLVSDSEGVEMIFPEKTLHGMGDVLAWYAGGTYSDGEKAPGVINIFFDENHYVNDVKATLKGDRADVDILVGWQASKFDPPSAKSKRISMDATQRWVVCRSTKNPYGLELMSYNAMAEPMKFTPGFARL
jgi:hypothetical protein